MLKRYLLITFIGLLTAITIFSCEGEGAGNTRDRDTFLVLALTSTSPENRINRQLCAEAVAVMNQCVGSGRAFSAQAMCNDYVINTGTTADATAVPPVVAKTSAENYTTLVSCVRGKVAEYNCNFEQNKVATAKSAYDSYFKACDAPAGIINSNMY